MRQLFLKRGITLLLAMSLLCSMVSGCGTNSDPSSASTEVSSAEDPPSSGSVPETGFPISEEKITLKIAVMQTGVQPDFSTIKMFQNYEELTNIHIEWEMIPQEFVAERRNIIMASGELPDAFMRCDFPATDLEDYASQGMFVKLDDYIEQYAPNFKAALEEYPDVDSGIRMSDGGIYSFPYIVSASSPHILKLFFNQNSLEATGQELPTTTDELYEVLKAIAGYDLNGNGMQDEIPLTGSIDDILTMLYGAWGLESRGSAHPYVDMDESGTVRFIPTSEEYKEVLQYVAKLYEEKLLDLDTFTMDYVKLGAKGEEGRVGSFVALNHSFMGQNYQDDYVGLETALTGPSGVQTVVSSPNVSNIGAFIITSANQHIEETIRWVDYFYGEEGMNMYFMGEEGVSYEITEDGSYEYLPNVTNNPNGLSYEQAVSLYVPWAGGCNPTIAGENNFKGAAMTGISLETANALAPYTNEIIWPLFTYSSENNQTMATLSSDIETYVTEMRAQFITGKKPFSEWDDYVAEFNNIGLEEYMRIYEEAITRYEP